MAKHIKDLVPAKAFHPGEHLLDEIKALGISQAEMARKMGMPRSVLNEIIKGQRNMTAKHALTLEKVTGVSAEYWMNLQSKYELNQARIEDDVQQREQAIEQWGAIESYIPVKYYRKQKVLTGDPVYDIRMVEEIFESARVEEIRAEYAEPAFERFRKSEKLNVDEVNVLGWSKLAEYNAQKEDVAEFQTDCWPTLESELRAIISKNRNVKEAVKKVLAGFGIKLIFQNKADKAPIDGYAFWSGENPAIAMTLRHKRLDNFAFTLYHELGHVFLHLLNDKTREVVDLTEKYDREHSKSLEEREANEFAQNHLIPEDSWKQLLHNSPVSEAYIIKMAKDIDIHPCIVLGRVCHEQGNYAVKTNIDRAIG